MLPLQSTINNLGISSANAWANVYTYSLMAMQNLDYGASAASRIDVEAGEKLRQAYGFVRFRVDKLLEMNLLGPLDKEARPFQLVSEPISTFASVPPIMSASAIAAVEADETAVDLVEATDKDGNLAKVEGALVAGLRAIADAEFAIHIMEPRLFGRPVGHDQMKTIFALQQAAISIHDLVQEALELLKERIFVVPGMRCCGGCGLIIDAPETDSECPLCGAGGNLMSCYPATPSREATIAYEKAQRGIFSGKAGLE